MSIHYVKEIRVTSLGQLKVKLKPHPAFHFVYRAACGVIWNDIDHCFEAREMITSSIESWYFNIFHAVYSELGIKLVLRPKTTWTDVNAGIQAKIRAFDGVMTKKPPKPTRAELTEIKLTDSSANNAGPKRGLLVVRTCILD